jgi:hypothetical protein
VRDFLAVWLIACGLFTLVWVTVAECANRRAARRTRAAAEQVRKMTTLIVAYDRACSPHPLRDDVVWVSTDNEAEAWAAIGGSAA